MIFNDFYWLLKFRCRCIRCIYKQAGGKKNLVILISPSQISNLSSNSSSQSNHQSMIHSNRCYYDLYCYHSLIFVRLLSILWMETLVWRLCVGCFVRCCSCWSRLALELHRRNLTSIPYFITGFLWYFYIYYLKGNVYNPKGTSFSL